MDALGLNLGLKESCRRLRIYSPLEIQKRTIPIVLSGGDVLGCAPTGQGKTAAFVLPILEKFQREPQHYFAVGIAPSRELAKQMCDQFLSFGQNCDLKCSLLVGGTSMTNQKSQIYDGVHIICGTPGRILEIFEDPLIQRKLRRVKILVLDEADHLLQNPMCQDVQRILNVLTPNGERPSPKLQYLFFTATIKNKLDEMKSKFLPSHRRDTLQVVDLVQEGGRVKTLRHYMHIVPSSIVRVLTLHHLLTAPEPHELSTEPYFGGKTRGIIFVSRIEDAEILRAALSNLELEVAALHSLQQQSVRSRSVLKFAAQKARILIATDVAARGLDLPIVDWVINMDVPKEFTTYVHRVGRCARAQQTGYTLTFVRQVLRKKDKHLDVNTNRMAYIQQQMRAEHHQTTHGDGNSTHGDGNSTHGDMGIEIEPLKIDELAVTSSAGKVSKAMAAAKVSLEEVAFSDRLSKKRLRRQNERQKKTHRKHTS